MKGFLKLFGLIFFIFVCFVVVDILYTITGSIFVTSLIGFILLLFYMRYKARQHNA